jgi:hypothetical protein
LNSKSTENPKASENASIAMGCLSIWLPSTAHSHVEETLNSAKENFAKGGDEWIQYGSAVAMAIACHGLQIVDLQSIQEISDLLVAALESSKSESVSFGCGLSLGIIASCLSSRPKG